MLEAEKVAPSSTLIPIGNIYKSTYHRTRSPSSTNSNVKGRAQSATDTGLLMSKVTTQRSLSLSPVSSQRHSPPQGSEEVSTMTIESLRARLLAERSTAKSAKIRIQELERKVHELERKLQDEVEKRMDAESALQESLEKMLDSSNCSVSTGESELESFVEGVEDHEQKLYEKDDRLKELLVQDGFDQTGHGSAHKDPEQRQKAGLDKGEEEVGDDKVELADAFHQLDDEDEEEDDEDRNRLSLPCAETLQPHINIHSDSDWATDEEGKLNSSSSHNHHHHAKFMGDHDDQELDGSDSDDESYGDKSCRIVLPSQLHLAQLDLASKIGRSLKSLTKPPRNPRSSKNSSGEMNDWVHHVVNMLDKKMCKYPQQNVEKQSDLPYVSFAKYLGVKSIEGIVEDGKDAEREGMVWRICEEEQAEEENAKTSHDHQEEAQVIVSSAAEAVAEGSKLFDDRINGVLQALQAAKKQLECSKEKRQVIVNKLR